MLCSMLPPIKQFPTPEVIKKALQPYNDSDKPNTDVITAFIKAWDIISRECQEKRKSDFFLADVVFDNSHGHGHSDTNISSSSYPCSGSDLDGESTVTFLGENPKTENVTIVLAVSGGPDSMAMADIMHKAGLNIIIATFDHRIRPASAHEVEMVRQWAQENNIPFESGSADVKDYAQKHRISEELSARELRYRFLTEVVNRHNASFLATAHVADDQLETLLQKIIRGTGGNGLSAIRFCSSRDGIGLIRPLLFVKKSNTEKYCQNNGVPYAIDETNFDPDYTFRNKIREHVLPVLRQSPWKNIEGNAVKTADLMAMENDFIEQSVNQWINQNTSQFFTNTHLHFIPRETLLGTHLAIQRRVLYKLLGLSGTYENVNAILSDINSGKIYFRRVGKYNDNTYVWLVLEQGRVIVFYSPMTGKNDTPADFAVVWPDAPQILLDQELKMTYPLATHTEIQHEPAQVLLLGHFMLSFEYNFGVTPQNRNDSLNTDNIDNTDHTRVSNALTEVLSKANTRDIKSCISLSVPRSPHDMKQSGLYLRVMRPGDKIKTHAGNKKISRIFNELGIPSRLRSRWPLLTTSNGEIVWVVGTKFINPDYIETEDNKIQLCLTRLTKSMLL